MQGGLSQTHAISVEVSTVQMERRTLTSVSAPGMMRLTVAFKTARLSSRSVTPLPVPRVTQDPSFML